MKSSALAVAATQAFLASASPPRHDLQRRSCPGVHVFGARETTASPGFGSSSTVVNMVTSAFAGSTSEAIDYPACGGQASCGGGDISEGVTDTSVPFSPAAVSQIMAAIFMGDPRYVSGLSYEVGTCTAGGISPVLGVQGHCSHGHRTC